ncbi:MAG: HAMP domain-containing histidine kinase [Bacteroidia bacterium]|jgi:signal transduction histidine kinase|nr:HAMP domain-containing histidine kinase [Bacteroidia bacterium]
MSATVTRNSPRLISLLVLLMLLIIISLVFLSIVFKYEKEKKALLSLLRISLSDVTEQYQPIMSNNRNFNSAMGHYLPLQENKHFWSDEENLVKNGSFSEQRAWFETEINYFESNSALLSMPHKGGTSAVTADPHALHWGWYGSPIDKGGNLLLIDGPEDSNLVIWRQKVDVEPQKKYILQFHLTNISAPDLTKKRQTSDNRWQRALVQPVINGVKLPSAFVPAQVKQWQAYRFIWDSGNASTAEIELFDRNTSGLFNDFGLDMISLTEATEENLKLAGPVADVVQLPPYGYKEEEGMLKYLFYDYFDYRKADINCSVFLIEAKPEAPGNVGKIYSADAVEGDQYLSTIDLLQTRTSFITDKNYSYSPPVMLRNNVFLVLRVNNVNRFLYGLVVEEFFLFIIIIFIAVIMYILIIRFLKSNQELTMLKYTIINNVNHEIKTPVAVILAATEALQKYSILDNKEKTLQYLRMTRVQAERINTLLDKSLQTYAIEEENFQLQIEDVNMNVLLKEIVSAWSDSHREQLVLEMELPAKDCIIKGDKFHLTNIINTLIDNAVKHGGLKQVRVWMSMEVKNKRLFLNVRDNGQGIPAKHQKDVFEKFFQVPLEGHQKSKGYGLGLHYVKTIVELHKGSVSLTSDGVCGTDVQLQFSLYAQITSG